MRKEVLVQKRQKTKNKERVFQRVLEKVNGAVMTDLKETGTRETP